MISTTVIAVPGMKFENAKIQSSNLQNQVAGGKTTSNLILNIATKEGDYSLICGDTVDIDIRYTDLMRTAKYIKIIRRIGAKTQDIIHDDSGSYIPQTLDLQATAAPVATEEAVEAVVAPETAEVPAESTEEAVAAPTAAE